MAQVLRGEDRHDLCEAVGRPQVCAGVLWNCLALKDVLLQQCIFPWLANQKLMHETKVQYSSYQDAHNITVFFCSSGFFFMGH